MPSDQHVQLMSRFECEGENATFIEPLTGSARHPLADIRHWANTKHTLNGGRASGAKATNGRHKHCKLHGKEDAGLFNISHLVIANACGGRGRHGRAQRRRALYYDVGCSVFTMPERQALYDGTRPSLPLIHELYQQNCIDFDRTWAWEAKPMDAAEWWQDVPVAFRSKLHFYNTKAPKEPHENGVVALIKATATPTDFVVLKLDIDNSEVEHSIVQALLSDGLFASLVDEFFFEYHFTFDGIVRAGTTPPSPSHHAS